MRMFQLGVLVKNETYFTARMAFSCDFCPPAIWTAMSTLHLRQDLQYEASPVTRSIPGQVSCSCSDCVISHLRRGTAECEQGEESSPLQLTSMSSLSLKSSGHQCECSAAYLMSTLWKLCAFRPPSPYSPKAIHVTKSRSDPGRPEDRLLSEGEYD